MTITRTFQGPGAFDFRWKAGPDGGPAAPKWLRDSIELCGWTAAFARRGIPVASLADADVLALLKADNAFHGPILAQPDDWTLTGCDSTWFLGRPDGTGTKVYTVTGGDLIDPGAVTTTDIIDALLPVNGITKGSVTNGTNLTNGFAVDNMHTVLEALNYGCDQTDVEWVMRADFTFDAAPKATLFPAPSTTDATIITTAAAGREGGLRGVEAIYASRSRDAYNIVTAVVYPNDDDGEYGVRTITPEGVSWVAPDGDPMEDAATGLWSPGRSEERRDRQAKRLVRRLSVDHREVALSSRTYNVTADVLPGSRVWVWDLDKGLYDTDNPVPWRGGLAFPLELRVAELTYGVDGVYLRNSSTGEWVDVSEWVESQPGEVSWVVTPTGWRGRQTHRSRLGSVSVDGRSMLLGGDGASSVTKAQERFQSIVKRDGAQYVAIGEGGTLPWRYVDDAVVVSGDATLTSATASFVAADVGKLLIGEGIPEGTTVLSRTSGTEVEMTANATGSFTDVRLRIGPNAQHSRAALEIVAADLTGKWDAGERKTIANFRDKNGSPIASLYNVGGWWVTDDIRFLDGSYNNLISFKFRRAANRQYPGIVFDEDGGGETRTLTDGATTSGSAVVTSASALFSTEDRGRRVTGSGVPAGAYIVSIGSATSVTLSANATATATGVSLTIAEPRTLTDGATTSGSRTVTVAAAAFTSDDLGRCIIGSGIPDSAFIVSVDSSTQVTINANATATASGVTLTVTDTDPGTSAAIWKGNVAGVPSLFFRTQYQDAFRVASGDIFMLDSGLIHQLGAPTERRDAARYGDLTPRPASIVCGAGSTNLTTSLAVPTNHHAVVDYADFTVPTGCKLQARLRGDFGTVGTGTLAASDVLALEFYDNVSSSVVITNTTLTVTAIGGSVYNQRIVTPWVDVASSVTGDAAWRGGPRARNQTGARGNVGPCVIEFQYAAA